MLVVDMGCRLAVPSQVPLRYAGLGYGAAADNPAGKPLEGTSFLPDCLVQRQAAAAAKLHSQYQRG